MLEYNFVNFEKDDSKESIRFFHAISELNSAIDELRKIGIECDLNIKEINFYGEELRKTTIAGRIKRVSRWLS